MALGCRDSVSAGQWLPNSETSSSSTLSPLAPPFIVVRTYPKLLPDPSESPHHDCSDRLVQPIPPSAPNDVYSAAATVATDLGRRQGGSFTSGGPDRSVRRTLASNLVQAEPFYPQYGIRGSGASKPPPAGIGFNERSDYEYLGRNHTHWNEPFDGNSEWENGNGRRISSWIEGRGTEGFGRCVDSRDNIALESSSWSNFSGKGRMTNYGPAIQDGVNIDVSLPYENIWHRNHFESYAVKGQDDGCLNWLDGSSSHLQTSMTASTNLSNTSVLSEKLSANASVLQINVPNVSKESCGTLGACASSHAYHNITKEHGHRSDKDDIYNVTPYSYPKISSPPLRKMNTFSSSTLQNGSFNAEMSEPHHNNILQRHRVSVTIREPSMNLYVDDGKVCAEKNDKCNDTSDSCRFPRSNLNEYVSASELKATDLEKFSDVGPEVGKTRVSINGFTEVNDSIHNSATLDQSNNAVDSPCWKGSSASRYSPLFDSDSLQADRSNTVQKCEDLELTSLTVDDTKRQISDGIEKQSGNVIMKEVNGDCPSKESCLLPFDRSVNSIPLATKSTCENGFLNSHAATQSVLGSACNMHNLVKGGIPGSSSDISEVERSAEQKGFKVKENSSRVYFDTHFLVRSIYDLSALLSSCCNGENMMKEIDYDVLLLAKHNLEACLAKQFEVQKDSFLCQQKPSYVGDVNDQIEECRKTLPQQIHAPGECCESNAYKRLWIEAETALCSLKYELEVVRASVGLNNNMKQTDRDLQGSSKCGESPVRMMISPRTGSHTPTVTYEALASNNRGFGDNSGSCSFMPHVTSESNREDLETSVMARLNVLRSRDNMISGQQNKLQCLGGSESNLSMNHTSSMFPDSQFITGLGSFTELSESISTKPSQPPGVISNGRSPEDQRTLLPHVNANHGNQFGDACRAISEAQRHPKEFCLTAGTNDIIESYIPGDGLWRAQFTGKHSTAYSSDWEHVLKEEVSR